jgi:RimJ/RimL family protein N-acetyltransferase
MFFRRIERDYSQGIIAVWDLHTNVILGLLYYDEHEDCIIINYLMTYPYAYRRGAATFLLGFVEKEFRKKIVLGTQVDNERARKFYKKCGFKEIGRCRLDPLSLTLEKECEFEVVERQRA